MSVRPVTLACLDVETTDDDAQFCEVREIGLVPMDPDTFEIRDDVPSFVEVVKNSRPQSKYAFEMHKLRDYEGSSVISAQNAVCDLVREAWHVPVTPKPTLHLVGHNIAVFDAPVLSNFLGGPVYRQLFHYRVRDTSILARGLVDAGLLPAVCKDGKLTDLCDALGLGPLGRAHRALPDARDEALLYKRMIGFLRSCPQRVIEVPRG